MNYEKLMNGTLKTKTPLVTFSTTNNANYTTCKGSKILNYTFEDLTIQYQNGNYKSLVAQCGTSTAVHTNSAGVQNGIRFQFRVGKDQADTYAGTEFLGKKDL